MRELIGAARRSRRARIVVGVSVLLLAAGGLWAISPFFIRPVLVESSEAATVAVPSPVAPAVTGSAGADPSGGAPTAASAKPAPTPRLIARGELRRLDALHAGTGPVLLFELDGRTYLRFEGVSILNGPDLQVYLGRESGATHDEERDLHLGALKAPEGTFTYEVPAGTDLSAYRTVTVWCRAFRVVFTYAELEPA